MKRYWRIAVETSNVSADSARALMEVWSRTYESQTEAENAAEKLARDHPGVRYSVYEITSSYVVNGLTREIPEDLKAVAQEQLREGERAGDDFMGGLVTPPPEPAPPPLPMLPMNARYPHGTRVRTVKPPQEARDWTPEAIRARRWGAEGSVLGTHDSHGLYYDVRHDDQSVACYEPHELTRLVGDP